MQALRDLLKPERQTTIIDVGASPIDGPPAYRLMLDQGLCDIIGFEPIVQAFEALNERKGPHETYLPYILSDGGEHTLYLTQEPGMVSLLKPDGERTRLFERLSEFATLIGSVETSTARLDEIEEIPAVDMLRMDCQGSELQVLRHGKRHLANAVVVMTEVSFVPVYEGQPTFGEIDTELRAQGFLPHCFAEAKCWPITTGVPLPNVQPHQLMEADIVYVRDYTQPMAAEQWKHLALIAHCICGSYDLAMLAVEMAAKMEAIASDAPVAYGKLLEQSWT